MTERRATFAAAGLYAVLAILIVGQGLLPGRTLSPSDYLWTATPWSGLTPHGVRLFGANGELADAVAAFQPFTQHARAVLPSWPLWNPNISAGRPFLADMQSGVLSPFSLPSYVLPFWFSLAVVAALKLWVAAFGTFLLARALALRPAASLLAGLAFGFSLYMVTWLAWPLSSVWALMPWLLLAVDRVIRRPDALGVALLALVTGLQFLSGHPESSFHVGVVAVLFGALRLTRAPDDRRRRAGAAVLGLAAGTALAAIVLLPFLELVNNSGDLTERANRAPAHLRRSYLGALAMPEYWGRPTQVMLEPFINARAFYVGALPLLLAGIAVLRPTRERIALAATALACLAVAAGIPPFFQVANHLPGFSQAINTRLGIVACLALALLAAFGLDDVIARRARLPRALLAAAVVLPVVVVLVHAPVRLSQLGDAAGIAAGLVDATGKANLAGLLPLSAALDWLVLAGAGVALLLWRPLPSLLIALVALDLLRFGMGQNPAIPTDHAKQPTTAAIRFLQARKPARFAGLVPDFGITPLPADVAMRYGLYDARGYDYPIVDSYNELWRSAVAPRLPFIPPTTLAATTPESLRVLGMLGVRSLVGQPGDRRLALPIAYDGSDARIYDNPRALPRAWVVGRALRVSDSLSAVLAPNVDLRRTAVLQDSQAPLTPGAGGTAAITHYEDERVTLRSHGSGMLVLSDTWYPGWHATVDGHEAKVERVDHMLRGVRVGPGTHTVEMTYRPLSFRIGWIVSLLTALALGGAVLLGRRR
ncbi:MAG TPA: YfhO family protein [Solirubrobacteraceae bacterium]|nr:YfhO family protein [Solirubrobacteraceae bacterium]